VAAQPAAAAALPVATAAPGTGATVAAATSTTRSNGRSGSRNSPSAASSGVKATRRAADLLLAGRGVNGSRLRRWTIAGRRLGGLSQTWHAHRGWRNLCASRDPQPRVLGRGSRGL
jgi:hypothetical protein